MAAPTLTPRDRWIDEGLKALAAGGPDAVRIEPLARTLGVTKGGFYGQFRRPPRPARRDARHLGAHHGRRGDRARRERAGRRPGPPAAPVRARHAHARIAQGRAGDPRLGQARQGRGKAGQERGQPAHGLHAIALWRRSSETRTRPRHDPCSPSPSSSAAPSSRLTTASAAVGTSWSGRWRISSSPSCSYGKGRPELRRPGQPPARSPRCPRPAPRRGAHVGGPYRRRQARRQAPAPATQLS